MKIFEYKIFLLSKATDETFFSSWTEEVPLHIKYLIRLTFY
ncbi:uncharacterized protein METZ01_LOCUS434889 [marine metagenome]|uniref:Uncharacterized protein n=1 Tax=marine metagenome TaxID=408172 RepID=A0A382YGR5_9ZZZZ